MSKLAVMILGLWAYFMCSVPLMAQDITQIRFADAPFPPYTIGKIGQQPTGGVAIQLMEALFSQLGIEIHVQLYPWKRALKMAKFGKVDGIPLLMRTREHEQFLTYTEMLFETRNRVYFDKNRLPHFTWASYADLKPYTIALVSGYPYETSLLNAVKRFSLKVIYTNNAQESFRLLSAKRVDLCIEEETVAQSLIAADPAWEAHYRPASKSVSTYPYYVAFSNTSKVVALLPQVNRLIAKFKRDGVIEALRNQGP